MAPYEASSQILGIGKQDSIGRVTIYICYEYEEKIFKNNRVTDEKIIVNGYQNATNALQHATWGLVGFGNHGNQHGRHTVKVVVGSACGKARLSSILRLV